MPTDAVVPRMVASAGKNSCYYAAGGIVGYNGANCTVVSCVSEDNICATFTGKNLDIPNGTPFNDLIGEQE